MEVSIKKSYRQLTKFLFFCIMLAVDDGAVTLTGGCIFQ